MRQAFHGHFWTVRPHLENALRPARAPRDEPWSAVVDDPDFGPVRLSGWLRVRPDADTLVVLIHGLGGSADSRYVARAARACDEAGLSYLRLNLRGADRRGEDFYHAGLSADVSAALASPELAPFAHLFVVGYSMGGHIALRWASSGDVDPRVRAAVAVCAPLDLAVGATAINRPLARPYQWHLLRGLKEMYRAASARRAMPCAIDEAMRIRTIMAWDEAVVAPRFGFSSRDDYYAKASAGPVLDRIALPTLFVAAEADPMVTAESLHPWLDDASDAVEIAWTGRGGHVGFPDDLDLGFGDVGALEPQLVRWLLRHR